jgi:uncharacterized protein (DUF1684 family)
MISNRLGTGACVAVLVSMSWLVSGVAPARLLAGDGDADPAIEAHREAIEDWRMRRHQRLSDPDGWMTLVGLEWLQDGANRVGSAAENGIRLPGGPGYWGTVYVEPDGLRFVRADNPDVTVDDALVAEARLLSDADGTPTRVRSGSLSFYPIWRESYALRVKDAQSPVLLGFTGIDNYDIQWDWRIGGRLVPAEEGETIEIANVQGQIVEEPVLGTFEFERDGKTHRLLVQLTDDPPVPWIIFNDRTNSHGTYGAGRYVYVEEVTDDNRIIVDFNKAYNPPCAFTDFATCPIPPPANRLDLAVTAGEKDFHSH